MSRKIPLCAYCGGNLLHAGRMLTIFEAIPGKPYFGWHMEEGRQCYEDDVVKVDPKIIDPMKALAEIEKRGAGRVLWNKKGRARSSTGRAFGS